MEGLMTFHYRNPYDLINLFAGVLTAIPVQLICRRRVGLPVYDHQR
ncbi:hypothetical protein ymoll0001_27940 [Yersinia mollaretii ATCC 43969]|uniref:Inner membrane protein n=1 Tax=Yersinia mollaretii (strain ATCC 43969 / DSM 18520 / CIP 103324 / CNY 7263 / WAIP 204) TaxID=349967 RepID=A0ABP2EBA5_YERMW|nr:hypothetical protein ymoll0001_27940 [Yersinia mollaretii ATCC 43969]